jgi:Domain of unknown function (DUF3543)
VCVEEVLYRQALCMGREAAVDELLGQYETSATLYTRAKLTLEQLAREPLVGEADREVLLKYSAGFTWRLHELRTKLYSEPTTAPATSAVRTSMVAAVGSGVAPCASIDMTHEPRT